MLLSIDNLGKVAVTVEENYWSLNKDYDKLTIVEQEGVFGTFISRKPVPAGTPLTDRKYWIRFSSLKEEIVLQFNSLINELRNLEIDVDKKEAEIYKAMASIVAGGVALKQSFGDAEDFGISQKVLTESRDYIQQQINNIVSDTAKLSLEITPNIVFMEENKYISFAASSDSDVTEITITDSLDNIIAHGSKSDGTLVDNSLWTTINITFPSTSPNNVTYKAIFKFNGGNVKEVTSSLYPVPRIYFSGVSNINQAWESSDGRDDPSRTPYGTYKCNIYEDGNYWWLFIPAYMTVNSIELNGFEFPTVMFDFNPPQGDDYENIPYKAYRSFNTLDAGEYSIVVS